MQATASALLFATMAIPAYAHGNGEGRGHGNGKDKHQSSEEGEGEHEDRGLHLGWFLHGSDDESSDSDSDSDSACLDAAKTAKKNAMTLAEDAYNDALATARTAYLNAVAAATQTRTSARLSARATFLASDKGATAWSAYLSARKSANKAWGFSVRSTRAAWASAKEAAASAKDAARAKAIADLQAATAACGTTVPPASDTILPGAITDLSLSGVTSSSVILNWTSSGDDASMGTVASYDVRYSTSAITDANFASAAAVIGEPVPSAAGTSQSMTVSGLASSTTYYFAIKSSDDAANLSALSNVVSTATMAAADTIAPAAVSDLSLSNVTSSAVNLNWSAPGDDGNVGTASSYDVRYSTSVITAANFGSAAAVTGEPAPAVAGTVQSMTVSGLTANTAYYFAIKATDNAANVAAISNVATVTTAP